MLLKGRQNFGGILLRNGVNAVKLGANVSLGLSR